MTGRHRWLRPVLHLAVAGAVIAQSAALRTTFRIKYVSADAVYLDGGRNAGLAQKMRLSVPDAAELEVLSVADASAVCEIKSSSRALKAGDVANLSAEDAQTAQLLHSKTVTRRYAQVITFTGEGDPLDEEVRASVPHPPLPEVNRIRGRIGVEYNSLNDVGGLHSYQTGLVLRADMTRIGGTYWNFSGYTRMRLNSRSGSEQATLTDLLNRTYHLTLSYNNPDSNWTMGFGRFYLPWAASLSTIDGGYLGRRISKRTTVAMFAGTTPDPSSWNYNPNRQMAGTLVNYEGGDFESFHYSSTAGVALSRLNWRPERQFLFFENAFVFKRYFTLYHDLEVDKLTAARQAGGSAVSPGRSFLTLRYQPHKIVAFDVSHNYFRDFPTFDPRLIGLGLVDRFLFQGVSFGTRLELPYRVTLYSNVGRSNRSGDTKHSLNQMYGAAKGNILGTGVRADFRYSKFDSSFGRGTYKALSLERSVRENLRLDVQAGQQNFGSPFTTATRARYVNSSLDWYFGARYFLGGGLTVYRGQAQNYNQTYFNLGYRF